MHFGSVEKHGKHFKMQWKCSLTHFQRVENALQWKNATTLFSLNLLFPQRVTNELLAAIDESWVKSCGTLGIIGCLPLRKKLWEFQLKVKWNRNFLENPFRNCRLPAEVVLFLVGNWMAEISLTFAKLSSFQSLISQKQFWEITGIANGKSHFIQLVYWFGKTLTIFPWSSQFVDKW